MVGTEVKAFCIQREATDTNDYAIEATIVRNLTKSSNGFLLMKLIYVYTQMQVTFCDQSMEYIRKIG